jgi:hypothetical protein
MTKPDQQRYREAHRNEINERTRRWAREVREEVIRRYGGKCVCCLEQREEFLLVDLVEVSHAQQAKGVGKPLYQWLRQQGFPEGYQVFCQNCSGARRLYGYCPHRRTTQL